MNRDMSSPMDASLSTRNQGQLISTATQVTTTKRVGDMRQVPLDQPQARAMARGPAYGVRPIAQSLSDVSVTGLGSTTLKWVGVSAVAGIVLWHLLLSGRRARKSMAQTKAREAVKDL